MREARVLALDPDSERLLRDIDNAIRLDVTEACLRTKGSPQREEVHVVVVVQRGMPQEAHFYEPPARPAKRRALSRNKILDRSDIRTDRVA